MPARSQIVLCGALLGALLVSLGAGRINPYHLDVIIGIGINIILAVSLNLINGYTGQFSLGHAGFMAVGAYSSAVLTTNFGARIIGSSPSPAVATLLFVAALLLGGMLAALAGLLVGVPSLRLKGDYLAIVTLGFGEIIRVILQNVDAVGGARGMVGIPAYTNLFWTFAVAAVTVYVVWGLVNSTYGRGFLAVSDDEVAAEAMGINTTRYKITAFVVGAFFAGVAGGIYAHFKQFIAPSGFDFNKSVEVVVIVVLGGMGNNIGVIIAAVLLTVLTETLRKFGDYRMVTYSLLLVVLMLTCPGGLVQIWHRLAALCRRQLLKPARS